MKLSPMYVFNNSILSYRTRAEKTCKFRFSIENLPVRSSYVIKLQLVVELLCLIIINWISERRDGITSSSSSAFYGLVYVNAAVARASVAFRLFDFIPLSDFQVYTRCHVGYPQSEKRSYF